MNIVYLHGFQSNSASIKGRQLQRYCQEHHADYHVHLPDLNAPPLEVMQKIDDYMQQHSEVVLVGSSLGGFYATCAALKHGCRAVLINPVVEPWTVFAERFAEVDLPYQVHENWCLDAQHLLDLKQLHHPTAHCLDKFLVLLQQGDEVLDYRDAQRYYSQGHPCALVITETHGQHAMTNFAEKIPMLLTFLSQHV
ncbi:YqiA/YcfP family alpha/beta fold hydrolase [Acinetobacter sp. MD2(2019)]|uniref:YqiA/YcfP family alpha/beta fold hydrolase n=1 Tax=Acinetobacter sp. MD2(2019) TaxID=2605273 RepID=UPI002D1F23D5|nr:YqiA/YcfP family alpha/beta fold hydrolase [Acinetobacter sp. MD2(2019)]MEB3753148.1 alpha/beta fold hydrolase [Acinetobacter sp. MD2(2019)]